MADYKIALHDVDAAGIVINLFPITKAKYVSLSGEFSTPPSNRTVIDGTDVRITKKDNVNEAIYKLTKQNSTSAIDVLENDPKNPIEGQVWISS